MNRSVTLQRRIRALLIFFMAGLVLSGITAFPLQSETETLARLTGATEDSVPEAHSGMTRWIVHVRNGLRDTYQRYPFVAYGTDWLAFAHVVIAVFFIGPLRDPVRNIWVIQAGMAACVLVIPTAMICGAIRGIPFYWRLIDCSFGVLGFVPLWFCTRGVKELEVLGHPTSASVAVNS